MILVNKENIHECTFKFIEENNIRVINYEESMTDIYLKMIQSDYRFIIDRELIRDILIDIAYTKNPNDPLNKDLVLMTLCSIDEDNELTSES